ncbi:hypothetical protein AAMO2058_001478400 [Amorphochlora amoebiformis]
MSSRTYIQHLVAKIAQNETAVIFESPPVTIESETDAKWSCRECSGSNFKHRQTCYRCGTQKPPRPKLTPTKVLIVRRSGTSEKTFPAPADGYPQGSIVIERTAYTISQTCRTLLSQSKNNSSRIHFILDCEMFAKELLKPMMAPGPYLRQAREYLAMLYPTPRFYQFPSLVQTPPPPSQPKIEKPSRPRGHMRDYVDSRSRDYVDNRSRDYVDSRSRDFNGRSRDYVDGRSRDHVDSRSRDYVDGRSRDYVDSRSRGTSRVEMEKNSGSIRQSKTRVLSSIPKNNPRGPSTNNFHSDLRGPKNCTRVHPPPGTCLHRANMSQNRHAAWDRWAERVVVRILGE